MKRPGLRSMRALPLLEGRRTALETCVFCPKLCRTTCPVSNAAPRETLTPWGKMSLAWMAAHADVPVDGAHAEPAWACTGCHGCRAACDHRNDVAATLEDARHAFVRAGVEPEGARRVLTGFARHETATRAAARRLAAHPCTRGDAKDALLVGCAYLRAAPREARDAVDAACALVGGNIAIIGACCGLPLHLAGGMGRFAAHARTFARAVVGRSRVIVADAGCARTLRLRYAEVGAQLPRVELLIELAAASLASLAPVEWPLRGSTNAVRWHDPCQLGRGLGIYDAPRAVLTRALGRPPDELEDNREHAPCSGAGGLVPRTMPAVAQAICDGRLDAHARAGGGRIVTACASSLLAMRRRAGAGGGSPVDDIVTWIARSVGAARARS